MAHPTSPELQNLFRDLLPERFRAGFDGDVEQFGDTEGYTDHCGVLMALGWVFDRLIAASERDAIGRVLAAMVVPQMGPLAKTYVRPEWLLPDPNARLYT